MKIKENIYEYVRVDVLIGIVVLLANKNDENNNLLDFTSMMKCSLKFNMNSVS